MYLPRYINSVFGDPTLKIPQKHGKNRFLKLSKSDTISCTYRNDTNQKNIQTTEEIDWG